jgi:hypothetical protein
MRFRDCRRMPICYAPGPETFSYPAGCYRYEADPHRLVRITKRDLRAETGSRGFTDEAPPNLVCAGAASTDPV